MNLLLLHIPSVRKKEKIDQVISVVLIQLAKKDIERFPSAIITARLINPRSPIKILK